MSNPRPNSIVGLTATESLSVLLVDDNQLDRTSLANLLEELFGRQVSIWQAQNGSDAIEVLGRHEINVTLFNYQLADMDALELLATMARLAPHTATILMIATGCEPLAIQAIRYGVNDYLTKQELDRKALGGSICRAMRRAKIEQDYTRSIGELRQRNSELSHLVRALSHDMSANHMLLDHSFRSLKRSLSTQTSPGLQQSVTHVEACLSESKKLLEDLELLAKTGSVDMEPARVDTVDVVDEVLFEQRHLVVKRGVAHSVERPIPAVFCNRHRLKQVISNLLRNALEHGCDAQRPRISISSSADGNSPEARVDDHRAVSIRIHDNGPGIERQSHDEAFLPGRRMSTTGAGGSGMGLAIVKQIVQHYGGTVRIDTECREGFAVVLTLPAAPTDVDCSRPHVAFPGVSGVQDKSPGHGLHEHHRSGLQRATVVRRSLHGRS